MSHNTVPPFTDLEIRILKCDDKGYPVELTLGGQQEAPRGYLAADILPWATSSIPLADGQKLTDLLLADRVLRDAWALARGQSPHRRIRLRIDPDAAELHTLPWELLLEDTTFIAANAATPFSRYLPVFQPWGSAVEKHPIRVLAVIAIPTDPDTYDRERSILEQALSALSPDQIRLDWLPAPVTLERLEETLRAGYHVLHFVGHGRYSSRDQQAALLLQDATGKDHPVRDTEFVEMLKRQQTRPRLVFLVACQSAARSPIDAFAGLAPKLVAAGVPAVVAMQDSVAVSTAQELTHAFYKRLAEHGFVDCAR